ncbi:MAG TPA: hypothetical protein VGC67_17560 [Cellulomonas sp.]
MAETEIDLREYSLVLVSNRLLAPVGDSARALARDLVAWAHRQGHGIVQLGAPAYRVPGGHRSDDAALDRAQSEFVLSQLRVYVDAGYRVAGLVLTREDLRAAAGRRWLGTLHDAAHAQGVALGPTWVVPRGATRLDPARHLQDPAAGPRATGTDEVLAA